MIPDDVRRYAEDPAAWPAARFPPEGGLERVLTDRYCALFGPVPSFTTICRLRLDPDEIPEALAEVRALVSERSHRTASWWVGSSAAPADLAERLVGHGLVSAEGPGWEPHATSMALVDEPPAGPTGIDARAVESFEEFAQANRIATEAFDVRADEQAEWEAVAPARWKAEQAGHAPRTYLAYADGVPIGAGRGIVDPDVPAVLLIGGSVLERARGRGVYRSLVRARWDDAVAAGTPALVTQAGAISRPILEALGFEPVAETEILLDPRT